MAPQCPAPSEDRGGACLTSCPLRADLENAYNNYMLDMSKPHGYPQAVNRWHSAGVGGGSASATNGKSIWSWAASFDSYLYRGDVGTESIAASG